MSEQGTAAWHAQRLGKLTASRIADATARIKAGWGASRAGYMAELLTERLTGQPYPRYSNAAMEWGTQNEPEARTVYEFERNVAVVEVGFVVHSTIAMSGASPDGLVDDGGLGLVEFKCPNTATHIESLLGAEIDGRYYKQMQWQMACSPGRRWCDFVSYDPRLPVAMRMLITRVPRDDKMIAKLEAEAEEFLDELAAKEAQLLRRYSGAGDIKVDNLMEQLRQSAAMA
jgi:putative phage-type endonuclease